MNNYVKNPGFTLVELSIVLVVIALIAAGVMSGANLVKVSKLRNVISEFRMHEVSIDEFKAKFKYLPGDFPDANKYWSVATPGNGDGGFSVGASSCSGNISTNGAKEDVKAWKHLELAGLVKGQSYQGDCVSGAMVLGSSVPASKAMACYILVVIIMVNRLIMFCNLEQLIPMV